jgi:hypothetical protein
MEQRARAHSAGTTRHLALSASTFARYCHSTVIALDIMLTYLRA